MSDVDPAALLAPGAIRLAEQAADKTEAIRLCGQALVDCGAVEASYVPAMLEREESVSTYIGEGVAIPHATLAGKEAVLRDALCFVRFPAGVDWDGAQVTVCIGIAAQGDGHVEILAELAQILLDPERAEALRAAESVETVLAMLTPAPEDTPEPTREGER
ncbi:PTS sugar transporter subunit IIA [Actinotalea sp. BY-33]|uniref:Mannitol-specific phosphotransferase enzyme IIA component n=1 Tax=Actinotalea soli TaxID=2819234 RepID=A0A939LVZ0_9CELL|nr:PTS sugar transporter subunit IIA [Actinotalea soli]MBO1752282.1 PTS sugar transporter subunit IIA [Actinotalea soli]